MSFNLRFVPALVEFVIFLLLVIPDDLLSRGPADDHLRFMDHRVLW